MEFLRIRTFDDSNFKQAWVLYQEAFPLNEQRSLVQQLDVLKNDHYYFEVVVKDEELIGILLWWEFKSLKFIDHFAVHSKHRGKGFGKEILEHFNHGSTVPVLLEVEFPTNEINQRRINFYQRLGYFLNDYDYKMPSYVKGAQPIPLKLMSFPKTLKRKDYDYFVNKCLPIIYSKP